MQTEKKLYLLDAMALIYRAFYALNKNPIINSKGLNTSAILGFANTLYDLIKNEKPTHLGVAFDTIAPTFRHDDFARYKANRQEMPEDLSKSIPYIKSLIEAFNIPLLFVDGYEADDVIGTLAKKAEKAGFTTYMVTSDKDFGQIVNDNILIYKPGRMGEKSEIVGKEQVCEKFGIKRPEQVTDMLGLWGDASDNIPGVPSVGEVTARKLIAEFDNVENLIANAEKISNEKLRNKIIQYADQAIASKNLATIILDVPIEFNENKLLLEKPNIKQLKQILDELEFRTFAKRVFTDLSLQSDSDLKSPDLFSNPDIVVEINEKSIKNTPHTYHLIKNLDAMQGLVYLLLQQKSVSFDTETTGLDPNNCELVGMSFCFKPFEAYYVPVSDSYYDALETVKIFKPFFENDDIEKIGHNLKFDIEVLHWYEIEVKGNFFDTMIAHYLLQPDLRNKLDFLSKTYLDYNMVPIEDLIGKKDKNQKSMRSVEVETVKEYAAEDADIAFQLKHIFAQKLKEHKLESLFYEVEMPLLPVLVDMEVEGVKVDIEALNQYSAELAQEIKILENEIISTVGYSFNISSPKQLGEVLFDKLKIIDNPKQTKTKQYSTGEEILQKLVYKHPIIPKILDYRSLTKLKSTYVDTLPLLINPRTGRIHTTYNQAVASTGRLSSNNPNLQNIPIRTEKGREIRRAFVPRNKDYLILSADYSQIELRIIASLSNDENMLEDFRKGLDIHSATASRVFGIPIEEVTPEMRRSAKMVNFGIVYGISAFGLSERLNISRREAAAIIDQYFKKYPGIKNYMENTINFARKYGFVQTILGRKRYVNDINSANFNQRGFAERNAINAPIQGSSADMIKIAMINIFKSFKTNNLKSKLILQVHDELVFDIYKPELESAKDIIVKEMKNALLLTSLVDVDVKFGNNWLEAY